MPLEGNPDSQQRGPDSARAAANPSPSSVGDVFLGSFGSGEPRPQPRGSVAARVRNESDLRADVTLRFLHGDSVVHLAFVRVLPATVTTVGSGQSADILEVSGVDELGEPLRSTAFVFGRDFDESTPAEYRIGERPTQPPAPAIALLEPDSDITLSVGSTLTIRWTHLVRSSNATVQFSLSPVDAAVPGGRLAVGPEVALSPDVEGGELSLVLTGVLPGLYEVIGVLRDGESLTEARAAGRVQIEEDAMPEPPDVAILAPAQLVELFNGDGLFVRWETVNLTNDGTLVFSLESGPPVPRRFVLAPPLTVEPGEASSGSAVLTITGIVPGLYDLVATLRSGIHVATARARGVVRVAPEPVNEPPQLVLLEPAVDVEVPIGGSVRVHFLASDPDDDARLSLFLDPDAQLGTLNGNEIPLLSALSEDQFGPAGVLLVNAPPNVAPGVYRVAGLITDGRSETVTWAPGLVYLGVPLPDESPPPQLALPVPTGELLTRAGQEIPFQLDATDVPAGTQPRLFLSNVAFGGDIRADVTPAELVTNAPALLTLPSAGGLLPNDAWPRQFRLEAEIVAGGMVHRAVADATIWIRQEVEILSARMVNYDCEGPIQPLLDATGFRGVEVTWFGGGFKERETHRLVAFWLARDGIVAPDQTPDSTHVQLFSAPESPNVVQTTRIPLSRIVPLPTSIPDFPRVPFENGEYLAVAAVNAAPFGHLVSGPHPDPVELCFPFEVP